MDTSKADGWNGYAVYFVRFFVFVILERYLIVIGLGDFFLIEKLWIGKF